MLTYYTIPNVSRDCPLLLMGTSMGTVPKNWRLGTRIGSGLQDEKSDLSKNQRETILFLLFNKL